MVFDDIIINFLIDFILNKWDYVSPRSVASHAAQAVQGWRGLA
jgi:hypothetical protein